MSEPRWKQRYRAPSLTLPRWAPDDPDRLVYVSNLSGSWQVHAWDRAADRHRQVSDHPTGVVAAGLTPDGARVVWFEDSKGDEVGRWLQQPFEGGEATPLVADAGPAWSAGLALGPKGQVAVGLAGRDGFSVRVGEIGGNSEELYRHQEMVDVGGLSRDGRLLVVHHAEHGDNLHPALRAFELEGMTAVADLWDGAGLALFVAPAGFSPVAGAGRRLAAGRPHLHGPRRALPTRPAQWRPGAARAPGRVDPAGRGAARRDRLVPAVLGRCRPRGPGRRERGRRATPARATRPLRGRLRELDLPQPPGRPGPRVPGRAAGGGAASDGADRPRRPPPPRRRQLGPGGPGVRRPRLRGRPGQLPRLHRLRQGLAGRARGRPRPPRDRGRGRRPRRPDRPRPGRPRPDGHHRRLLGRVRDPAGHRHRPRGLAGGHGRGPGGRLPVGLRGRVRGPPGVRPQPVRWRPRGQARPVRGAL